MSRDQNLTIFLLGTLGHFGTKNYVGRHDIVQKFLSVLLIFLVWFLSSKLY